MKDREKELKYLIYLKNELLKEIKKDLKQYRTELQSLNGQKTLVRKQAQRSH